MEHPGGISPGMFTFWRHTEGQPVLRGGIVPPTSRVTLDVMRRFAVQCVVLAVLLAACGSANETTVASATTSAPESLRTGREAILANNTEGEPYVLWYWGAH